MTAGQQASPTAGGHPRMTLVAGTFNTSSTGFSAGIGGSITPDKVGQWTVFGVIYEPGQDPANPYNIALIGPVGVTPPDDNTSFVQVAITGIFSDSGGGTVTRTLVRAARNSTSTIGVIRDWDWSAATAGPRFISGNSYFVQFT